MSQYELPKYVESDLSKTKIKKPPRNRKKEKDIYIYNTNKPVKIVTESKGGLAIQAKLSKSLKAQITTPLNFDIAKPKLANISKSAAWGNQINGIVYEKINVDIENYSFITFNIATTTNIRKVMKYRIINYDPIYDNDNNFIYATFNALIENDITIDNFLKFNWNIVNEFHSDIKTKYIKIEFDERMQLFYNSLKIAIKPDKTSRKRNVGYNINNVSENLALKFIKIRQTGPFEFDDLTFLELKEDARMNQQGAPSGIFKWIIVHHGFSSYSDSKIFINQKEVKVENYINLFDKGIIKYYDYFSRGLEYKYTNRKFHIKERAVSNSDVKEFLNGTFVIDKIQPSNQKNLHITKSPMLIKNLDKTQEADKSYFILTKQTNLIKMKPSIKLIKQLGDETGGALQFNKTPKLRLIRSNEISNNFITQNKITIEIELSVEGFNPLIEFDVTGTEQIKITQYDNNHKIIGIPELSFDTEFKYDDSKKNNTIQL